MWWVSDCYDTMPIQLEVQRTIKRADMWAVCVARANSEPPVVMKTDTLGVVQAQKKRTDCVPQFARA